MKENLLQIVSEYINKTRDTYEEAVKTGELTPELSYRPLLDEFLVKIINIINPKIGRVFEPKKQPLSGRPDWRFYNTDNLGVYGYVEAKGLDLYNTLKPKQYEYQIETYRNIGHKLILTDGLDFIFYYPGIDVFRIIPIIEKTKIGTNKWCLSKELPLLENELKKFFENASARSITEEQLIVECAIRAKALARNIDELSDAPVGSGMDSRENDTIECLKNLKDIVEKQHDPSLNDKKMFSGFVAQVLIFGLIYAHRVVANPEDNPNQRYSKIKNFWKDIVNNNYTNHLRPFKALALLLENELSSFGPLGVWYEDCCLLLSHVRLTEEQEKNPDYHKLFELFLAYFDPKTRFDYGAFYTPRELADFTVSLSEHIAQKVFSGDSLYENGNKLVDPCCGTGSFIEKLVKSSKQFKSNPSIIGFEILPGPYALAHYRMSIMYDEYPDNLDIVLTNTLKDDLEEKPNKNNTNLITEEQNVARELSKTPLTLIIGNPPSTECQTHSFGEGFEYIQQLLEDFRPPQNLRTSRQNVQKQLQNEFIKFLRWSTNKLIATDRGIMALILPSSFAENSSYYFARKWINDNFSKFWIVDIDADGRTGVSCSSLFNTLQGRLLLVAVRDVKQLEAVKEYNYLDISSLGINEKIKVISTIGNSNNALDNFHAFEIDNRYIFRPKKEFNKSVYEKYWSLFSDTCTGSYIFKRHCSGLKLAPSSMFVHPFGPHLLRRSMQISDPRISVDNIISNWYSGQDKVPNILKFTAAVREEFGKTIKKKKNPIVNYSYRPLLSTKAIISDNILQALVKAPGGGTRYRPEVLSAYGNKDTIGITVAPSTRDLSNKLTRFTTFSWDLPDNDLCKRGNAHVFCNQFPEYKKKSSWDPSPKNNINEDLIMKLGITDTQDIVYYTYAILCSDKYLDKFEGALFAVSGNNEWPRIPITSDGELFKKIVNIGKLLAEFEKPTGSSVTLLRGFYRNKLNLFKEEFKLNSFTIDSEKETVVLSDDDSKRIVISPIMKETLNFQVSGYNVLQQWLKTFSYRYTRTNFNLQQYAEFLYLLQRIACQIKLVREIDTHMNEMLEGDKLLI